MRIGLRVPSFRGIFVPMGTKSAQSYTLKTAWESRPCNTIQEYLHEAYGKQHQAGHPHAFRGVNTHYDFLWSSFDRRVITDPDPIKIETGLLEEFIDSAWEYLTQQEQYRYLRSKNRWGSKRNAAALVVARHRLAPTRCLDWSYSPLCALFFACSDDSESEGEVWWFNRWEFDRCVEARWLALFGKPGNVMPEIEEEFREGRDASWFTGMDYMALPGDRPYLQQAWITVAGQLGTCHAEKIHGLGVCQKGRFVIPPDLKLEAIRELEQFGITSKSLGLNDGDRADEIATEIREEFEKKFEEYPLKNCATACKEDA